MSTETALAKLSSLDLSNDCGSEITSLLSDFKQIGFMVATFGGGKSIIRARPMNDGEARFTKVDDFSFKPQKYNSLYQRASTPRHTMFYGCTIQENVAPGELDSARLIGIAESMPWIRDKTQSGVGKIAFGRWFSHEPLNLLAIVNNEGYHQVNSYAKEVYEAFLINLSKQSKEEGIITKAVNDFLAKEFSKGIKSNLDYQISAVFTELMCQNHPIDGILYPSFRCEGQGLNVAIKPSSMNKLGLYVAGECDVYKLRDHSVIGNCAIIQLDGKTEKFEMKEIEPHTKECLEQLGVKSIEELK